jgi:hypothetical protein
MTRLSTRDRSCRSGSRWRYPPGLLLGSWVAGLNSAVHFPFSSLAARIPRARHHRHCRAATELVTGGRGYPAACERSFDAVAVNPAAPHHNPRPSSTRPTPHPAVCPGSAGPSTFMSINSSPGHCHVKLVEIAQWRCWFWSCIDGSAWGYWHFRRQCRARRPDSRRRSGRLFRSLAGRITRCRYNIPEAQRLVGDPKGLRRSSTRS